MSSGSGSRRAAWSLDWGEGPLVISWQAAAERQDPPKADDPRPVTGDDRRGRVAGWRAAAARWWSGIRGRGRVVRHPPEPLIPS